jgi:hypothetical protein
MTTLYYRQTQNECAGAAEWVVDSEGKVTFSWKKQK